MKNASLIVPKKQNFDLKKTAWMQENKKKTMIFSTSFPMFIDSLKSIRLYNWARKKNHRHINTNRVCSLKIGIVWFFVTITLQQLN